MNIDLTAAERMDADDPLRTWRDAFHLPNSRIYFAGHSLGLMPRAARSLVNEELDAWARQGVAAHFESPRPWFDYHTQFAIPLAELAGAQAREVVAMNSLTVNLHSLLTSFYRPTPQRFKILIERNAFPSDRYAVEAQLRLHGHAQALVQIEPRPGEAILRTEDIAAVLEREGSSIATVLLPGVQYLTGQSLNMRALAAQARAHGCNIGFDLAHAIGNVPLALHAWDVDFAVWCSYKYLNGGPGAIGGAFVHERHAHAFDLPRLSGWWGHDRNSRLSMPERLALQPGADGWQMSNPPILAMAPLLASLEIFRRAQPELLRRKSLQMTTLLAQLLRTHLQDRVEILTPLDDDSHGSQLSLRLKVNPTEGKALHERLNDRGIVCDWREPDVLRAAPVPLYNTFREIGLFVSTLTELLH